MRQDVGLDFEGNLIKVQTAPLEGKTPAILMHDSDEVSFCILYLVITVFSMFNITT